LSTKKEATKLLRGPAGVKAGHERPASTAREKLGHGTRALHAAREARTGRDKPYTARESLTLPVQALSPVARTLHGPCKACPSPRELLAAGVRLAPHRENFSRHVYASTGRRERLARPARAPQRARASRPTARASRGACNASTGRRE